jgi:hypothetical protein
MVVNLVCLRHLRCGSLPTTLVVVVLWLWSTWPHLATAPERLAPRWWCLSGARSSMFSYCLASLLQFTASTIPAYLLLVLEATNHVIAAFLLLVLMSEHPAPSAFVPE